MAKFKITFLFVRNPDLTGNGRLPLVIQDFNYEEKPLQGRLMDLQIIFRKNETHDQ